MSLDAPSAPLSIPTQGADDLTATNEPDSLANEQTWPTDEDMASSNGIGVGPQRGRVKRVPKGTSAYQAAWIFDDEDEDEDEDEDGDMETDGDGVAASAVNDVEELEETEEIELDSRKGETHRDLDPEEEEAE